MKPIDRYFDEIYNPKLLKDLQNKFGPFNQHHLELSVSTESMLRMMAKMKQKPRRGEVVMVVPNKAGQIWLHTKAFYPDGVYRLMTGGIDRGEIPAQALRREVKEETGFAVKIDRCLNVITYTLSNTDRSLPFVSYVFLTTPTEGVPQPLDDSEAIMDFRAVPVETLFGIAQRLRSLNGKFADWGVFRAVAHQLAGESLVNSAK